MFPTSDIVSQKCIPYAYIPLENIMFVRKGRDKFQLRPIDKTREINILKIAPNGCYKLKRKLALVFRT
jgi:hypothetical protein